MKIYNKNGSLLYDIAVDDSSVRYRAIMTDDSLTLNFSLTESISIPLYSYCEFEGARYMLWRPSEFKKQSSREHEYTLVMHGWREYLKFVKFKDLSAKPYRLKFSLTAKPLVFLTALVACLNEKSGGGWSVGACIDAPEKTLSFNHEYCIDVLNRLAQEFNTEFDFEDRKISLVKVEKYKETPLALSYGKGNGFLPGVGRYNDGDKQPVGRVFVIGGERNIDYSKYGSKTLLLPKSASLVLNGKTYRTDANGMYITRDGNTNEAEDSFDGSDIYPHRVGNVSEVVAVDAAKNFYDIKDSSIPENLNFRDCRIVGEKAIIKFESGALAGREFDLEQTDNDLTGYIHAERRFKIVPAELDGIVMPGGVFVPAVGDKYAIFNVRLPEAYISDSVTQSGASWDMFREAARYMAEYENDRFRFTGELDGIWSKNKWLEIGGKIVPGGHVLFSDTQFQLAGVVIRIVAVKDYVNKPHKPEITLSNAPISGSFGGALGKLEADEVKMEDNRKEVIRYSQRQWRDAKETMEMLQSSLLNFSGSINPLTVQTMQLIAGDESLQFRFVNSKTNPVKVDVAFSFNKANKTFTVSSGILQHMTLGIKTLSTASASKTYKFWDVAAYNSPALSEGAKSYYVYAKCAKAGISGAFILSETPIKMEADADFYHFLVGILNSENGGDRSFAPLYGFSEILPGRITTDKIVSQDGKTYFDLLNGIIGGRITFTSTSGDVDLANWAGETEADVQNAQNTADRAIADAEAAVADYNKKISTLQSQIDGEISNWFYPYSPTLTNFPASSWTDLEKPRHVGDTFTNTQNAPLVDAGKSWRFVVNNGVYSWTQIADSDAVLALQKASQAQSTADGKSTTYIITPTNYKQGDLWVLGADKTLNGIAYKQGEILTATQDSATFVESHWIKKVRYTDDTAVNNLQIGGRNLALKSKGVFGAGDIFPVWNYMYLSQKLTAGKTYIISCQNYEIVGSPASVYMRLAKDYVNPGIVQQFQFDVPFVASSSEIDRISFTTNGVTGAYIKVTDLKLEEGNKKTAHTEAPEDVQARIADAKQAGLDAQSALNATNTTVNALNSEWGNVTKDDIISQAETQSLDVLKKKIIDSRDSALAEYNRVYTNTYLEGTAKTNLLNSKTTFAGAVDALLTSLTNAISDGKTTVAEKTDVNNKFNSYNSASTDLADKLSLAQIAIEGKLKGYSDAALQAANNAQTSANNAQNSANTANQAVSTLNGYVDGAFKDGLIDSSEAKAIEKYINVVNSEKAGLEATYNKLYVNTYLEGTAKTNLLNAKVTYFGTVDALLASINTAISDGKTTVAEKADVDSKYSSYKTALASLQSAIEEANKAIQTKIDQLSTDKVNNLQIGGINLLDNSEYPRLNNNDAGLGTSVLKTDEADKYYRATPDSGKNVSLFGVYFLYENGKDYVDSIYVRAQADCSIYIYASELVPKYWTLKAGVWTQIFTNSFIGNGAFNPLLLICQTSNIYIDYKKVKIEEGNKGTLGWKPSEADVQARIADAQTSANNAQNSANTANQAVGNLNTYVDGAFKDGVIDWAEAKAIEKYINVVNSEKAGLEATYNKLYINSYLEGTAKTNLLNAKVSYFGAVDNLLASINTAISDGKTTVSEKADVDSKYSSYKTALASLQSAIEEANKAIQAKIDQLSTDKINNLSFDTKNLLLRSADYWYWDSDSPSGCILSKGVFKVISTGQANCYNAWMPFSEPLRAGQKYTFGIDLSIQGDYYGSLELWFNFRRVGEAPFVNKSISIPYIVNWKRYTITIEIPEVVDATNVYGLCGFTATNAPGLLVFYNKLSCVRGDKDMGYSEAPEDVQARISAEKERINEILSDDVADPAEKQELLRSWQSITAEYPSLTSQADAYSITTEKTNLANAYAGLDSALAPVLTNINVSTNTSGTALRDKFSTYCNYRAILQKAISDKINANALAAKEAADNVQFLKEVLTQDTVIGSTTYKSGIVLSSVIAVRNLAGQVTAYLNGLASKVYAFAAGVTNFASTDPLKPETRKIWFDFLGNAKIGNFRIGMNGDGTCWIEDKDGVTRIEFSTNNIEQLAELINASEITYNGGFPAKQYSTTETYTYPYFVDVVKDNSEVFVNTKVSMSASVTPTGDNFANGTLKIFLKKDGVWYADIATYQIQAAWGNGNINGDIGRLNSLSEILDYKAIGVPIGRYTVVAEFYKEIAGSGSINTSTTDGTFKSIFRVDNRAIKIGKDGISAFFNKLKYFHLQNIDGKPMLEIGGGLNVRGKCNIPGVPIEIAQIGYYGNISYQLTGMVESVTRLAEGQYRVNLKSGSFASAAEFIPEATAHVGGQTPHYAQIISWTYNSIDVWTADDSSCNDGGFLLKIYDRRP